MSALLSALEAATIRAETFAGQPEPHPVPPMTDPMGRHWEQPRREDIIIDKTHAMMSLATLKKLSEYSTSQPTGCYPGKMWRQNRAVNRKQAWWELRQKEPYCPAPPPSAVEDDWWLCWFGIHPIDPENKCTNNYREIIIV